MNQINGLLTVVACLGIALTTPATADEPADQLERAQLLRELLDTAPASQSDEAGANMPGAQINPIRAPAARGALRKRQFEDSQWRKLLGSQQMQANAPATQSVPQAQWRSQMFQRDRAAEDLSADILRRSQDWTSGHR